MYNQRIKELKNAEKKRCLHKENIAVHFNVADNTNIVTTVSPIFACWLHYTAEKLKWPLFHHWSLYPYIRSKNLQQWNFIYLYLELK